MLLSSSTILTFPASGWYSHKYVFSFLIQGLRTPGLVLCLAIMNCAEANMRMEEFLWWADSVPFGWLATNGIGIPSEFTVKVSGTKNLKEGKIILAHGSRNLSSQSSSFVAFALSIALGTKPWTNEFWRAVSYPNSFQSLPRAFLLAFYDGQLSKPASSALPSSPYKATKVIKGPTSRTLFYPSHLPKAPPLTLLT